MTLQEFKAWFEGFTENVGDKTPTAKQWKRICERVGEIDGTATSYPVFIDRWRPYQQYWSGPFWMQGRAATNGALGTTMQGAQCYGVNAMTDAGRAEAKSLSA